MLTYFNEWKKYPVQWLRNLFPTADVDDRDIRDVGIGDVTGYDRVHLFAGIGGWEYALQLAGWPDSEPVWTGSCPCQPFSRAGKKKGTEDERHLWPEMYRLIRECSPSVIFGEQVAGTSGLEWFDGVRTDLEKINYACGMAVLPAACVGSPHERERIFWVADSSSKRLQRTLALRPVTKCSTSDSLANSKGSTRLRPIRRGNEGINTRGGSEVSFWRDSKPILCSDGKWRRVPTEPSVFPLATRVPGDLGQLQAYGNAIVPQVAALFIKAYLSI